MRLFCLVSSFNVLLPIFIDMQRGSEKRVKYPINRNSLFFSDRDLEIETDLGMDYIMEDVGQSVILYRVDIERSNLNKTYLEAKEGGIVFKAPIKVPCMYSIEAGELRSYEKNKNLASYVQNGQLRLYVYEKTLSDMKIDIRRGDYIGTVISENKLQMFTVVDDGRANNDNRHTMYGTKPYYRSITCAEVNLNEFDGR